VESLQALIDDAITQHQAGDLDGAEALYREILDADPGHADANHLLGVIHHQTGSSEKAVVRITRALEANPKFTEAHFNLSEAFRALGRRDEAVESFLKTIAIDPQFVRAHNNLASTYLELGLLDKALASYRRAMKLSPGALQIANNYLHALLYDPALGNEELFDTYRRIIAARHPDDGASSPPTATPSPPDKKLRIGYPSSDFHDHPVGNNLLPLFANHDHAHVEIFCYAHETNTDAVTAQLQMDADHWLAITGLDDEAIAAQILDDGIHIMVYLGGHFDKNRPSVATLRPAPVQVSLFSGTTTALEDMDYWLTDAVLNPPPEKGGTTERFTEELFRLPVFYNYPKPDDAPPVSGLPAAKNGFITFASFNKPSKMNAAVLDLWSKVLGAVADSRLMLKYKNDFTNPALRGRFMDHFQANGIAPERIILVSADDSFHDHLAEYARADIGLDTFPFAGATTTFQALWMGVPVISLMTDRFIGRMGGALSSHVGLSDFAVDTPQAYIAEAAALAADLPRLDALRKTLRERVAASPLYDGPGYAASMERAFEAMWKAGEKSGGAS